jgi:hypothetical protein
MTRTDKIQELRIAAETAFGCRASRAANVFLARNAYIDGTEATDRKSMARAFLAVQEARDIVHFESSNRGETTNVGAIVPLNRCMGFLKEDAALGDGWVMPHQIA